MKLSYSPQHEALRQELRQYYKKLLTPEITEEIGRSEGVGPGPRKVVRQMGADGWLGIGWPKEYGGRGMTPIEQFIFFDESMRAGAPVPMLTVNSVAPTIMQFGSDEQKKFYLPKILKGEIHFAIGYTEPDAGTDLASLKTRAVRDGDHWVINGQKVFTSLATDADYIWLAVRTDPDAPKHKGISMIIVPRETPGVRIVPLKNMGNMNTNQTFYDDVRVPVGNLVGKLNGGWKLITNQLNHERVTLCSSGMIEGRVEECVTWAKETTLADGRRVIDQEWVQINLARIHARLDFLRLMNFKVAWGAEQGQPLNPAHASSIKVFGTEFYLEACRLMQEILGPTATLRPGSPAAALNGRVGQFVRSIHILTFGGGTNEMQRDLICLFGLGMPVMPRF
ncbi:MAG: acyl-CoA dehydrogenase family protein [Deltaproteobacteria bacterium]|nr:acyl-CoA dehydrogenase family protein [Deltaproteobacteria bacterium]MBI3386514.1 acyl-CoA dehydrogenase family protein [Deltaproteobacteria bacterium]